MTPTRCPTCHRPVAFYCDRMGYVHSYCPEAERLAQVALGPCVPRAWPTVTELPGQLSFPKPPPAPAPARKPRKNPPRKTGTCPQRRRKTPGLPRPATRAERLEGLRRYYLRKHGVAA